MDNRNKNEIEVIVAKQIVFFFLSTVVVTIVKEWFLACEMRQYFLR